MPHQATTLRRAKAQYRKSGPQVPPAEQRRLARAIELEKRANAAKEKDERKKRAERAKLERADRARESRRQMGIGLATQLAGYSHSQKAMKGGMEGWLGVCAKEKHRDDPLEDKIHYDEAGESGDKISPSRNSVANKQSDTVSESATDSFGSTGDMDFFLSERLSQQEHRKPILRSSEKTKNACGMINSPQESGKLHNSGSPTSKRKHSADDSNPALDSRPFKRARPISPIDNWADFFEGSTQIMNDIYQSSSPISRQTHHTIPPVSSQDLELTSDDLLDAGLPKTTNPCLDSTEGVQVRDFAYSEIHVLESAPLNAPGAPKVPRSFQSHRSMLRSFGKQPSVITPSPKMTANNATFTAAQCSFTADMQQHGFSNQILQQAIEDGDEDTEEEDEDVYSQALEQCKVPDNVLMPPPPIQLSPPVFKPSKSNGLLAATGGLQIFGLSTQILHDAMADADEDDHDKDGNSGLFSVPIKRPMLSTKKSTPAPSVGFGQDLIRPVSTALNHSTAASYHDLGLSTQLLKDAVFEEIVLTDDEDTR